MSDHSFLAGTRTGTVSGTLLVILSSIRFADILETMILAAIGAVVSFLVTVVLRRVFRKNSELREQSSENREQR